MRTHILITMSSMFILMIGVLPDVSRAQKLVLNPGDYKECVSYCDQEFKDEDQSEVECIKGCVDVRVVLKEGLYPLNLGYYKECVGYCDREFTDGGQSELECIKGCRMIGGK